MNWTALFACLSLGLGAGLAWRSWQWRRYRREVDRRVAEAERARRNMDRPSGVITASDLRNHQRRYG